MQHFRPGRRVSRAVTIHASDPDLPDTTWVLTFTADGLFIRRHGAPRRAALFLSWRSVVGHALIHRGRP